MSKVLASYPSKSSPGKVYNILEPVGGGDPYCLCWSWKRNRTCSHLKNYLAGRSPDKIVPVKEPAHAVGSVDAEISDAVNNIINAVA